MEWRKKNNSEDMHVEKNYTSYKMSFLGPFQSDSVIVTRRRKWKWWGEHQHNSRKVYYAPNIILDKWEKRWWDECHARSRYSFFTAMRTHTASQEAYLLNKLKKKKKE